ncbi:MAG TPA: sigma-E factor negative regulatory protein [Burkholderiales bacterium]|jgi:sigma-E factor negative regulatory protein RseA|nr:sigma-E factor negative regulatory protein [Burkholderiales bacterium]
MERISAFMDGEADDQDGAAQLARLKQEPALRRDWETYHLIGEALRGEAARPSPGFMARFSEALAKEPTVLAPRAPARRGGLLPRIALPLAASFGGVALVAWLAMSNNPLMPAREQVAATAPAPRPAEDATARDYIAAHQGALSYVRAVSARESDLR